MLRYQVMTVVGYLIGSVWFVRELWTHSDAEDRELEPVSRALAYFAFALIVWLPFAFYYGWLLVKHITLHVVLGFAKIAHHLRTLYRMHRLLRAGVTILACPCPHCVAKTNR